MTTLPRTRLQRVLIVLLLVSASLVAASALTSFLTRAHVAQVERRMMAQPALPHGHPPLPPGHPPIPPSPPAPPNTGGIRI